MENTSTPPPNENNKTKPKVIIVMVIIIVAIAGTMFYYIASNKRSNKPVKPEVSLSSHTVDQGYYQTEDELHDFKQAVTVNLTAEGPVPQTLNISDDTAITFHNVDSTAHQIAISAGTAIPNKFFNNRSIEPSNGYSFVIHQTGTFHYYFVDKSSATGTIIVK